MAMIGTVYKTRAILPESLQSQPPATELRDDHSGDDRQYM